MYPPGFQPVAPAPTVPAKPPAKTAAAPQRQVQAAKFISGDATATRIDLGADGKLPELKLDAAKEMDDEAEKSKTSNPWIVIGLLGFSVLASVVMLFFEPGASKTQSTTKAEARAFIQSYYLSKDSRDEPYQQRLRKALLAHNQGNAEEERQLYRDVLDMLHSESVQRTNKGLTGTKAGDPPPVGNANDQHLESLLSALLGR